MNSFPKRVNQNIPIDECNVLTSLVTTNSLAGTTVPWYKDEGVSSGLEGGSGEFAGFVPFPARPFGARVVALVAGG